MSESSDCVFSRVTRMPHLPFLHMLVISSAAIDNAIGVFVAREFIDTIGVTFGFIQVFLGIGSGLIFSLHLNFWHHFPPVWTMFVS
jgi:hypothetical protein